RILPEFIIGESGPHKPSLQKRTTQPPKYYTEGTLLRAMESAGKTVEDEELREAMKENGIGRPSTRAAIIETLFKRKYIYRNRKSIMASQAGIDLISTINEELLKSAKLTGLWENKLRRIERGEYSAADFINELKVLIDQIVISVLSDNSKSKIIVDNSPKKHTNKSESDTSKSKEDKPTKPRAPRIRKFEQIECPLCKNGHILKGRTAFGCSRFREGCSLRLNFSEYPEDLTPAKLRKMLQKKGM
ncbi:MAG: DNA topoisomerase III, partial [Duncaniella sp.]|nr:DNA topoisomerase III [Duncaniella sp.]